MIIQLLTVGSYRLSPLHRVLSCKIISKHKLLFEIRLIPHAYLVVNSFANVHTKLSVVHY